MQESQNRYTPKTNVLDQHLLRRAMHDYVSHCEILLNREQPIVTTSLVFRGPFHRVYNHASESEFGIGHTKVWSCDTQVKMFQSQPKKSDRTSRMACYNTFSICHNVTAKLSHYGEKRPLYY